MKVAIVTYHRTANFGAVLQMIGLQQAILESQPNIECDVIDYKNDYVERVYVPFNKNIAKSAKGFFITLLLYKRKKIIWKKFNLFLDSNVKMSPEVTADTVSELSDVYDVYIAGSDQIWNVPMNGWQFFYFLDFVSNNEKKYSYAASFGEKKSFEENLNVFRDYISMFKRISVREEDVVDDLIKLTNKEVECLPDPTLLHNADFWSKRAIAPKRKKKYILIYSLYDSPNTNKAAKKIKSKTNFDVVVINGYWRKQPFYFKNAKYVDPYEFLGYIRDAEFVITNSFHGTLFSILFHTKMFVELDIGSKHNNRAELLLARCGISNRTIYDIDKDEEIDWKNVDDNLSKMRHKGLEYLNGILNDAKETPYSD